MIKVNDIVIYKGSDKNIPAYSYVRVLNVYMPSESDNMLFCVSNNSVSNVWIWAEESELEKF